MGTFADELSAFNAKVKGLGDQVTRKVIFDMATAIVFKSPVGDPKLWKSPPPPGYVGGRFRANWQYGLDQINDLTTDDIDPSGQISLDGLGAVPKEASGHIHYWTNTLPYAIPLENGHSSQAPQAPIAIVGLTVLEFKATVDAAAEYVQVNKI